MRKVYKFYLNEEFILFVPGLVLAKIRNFCKYLNKIDMSKFTHIIPMYFKNYFAFQ